ncbi:MAG TPA: hypothetical protein VIV40_16145 [Kofleriaceae bacterium]
MLGAALVPAIASAQSADPNDPYAPQNQPAPTTTTAPDTTTTTTVVTPPQQPQQPPVVVVNPPPQPRTTVVTPAESYEVSDGWNAPVFATGALVFAGSYGASAIVASTSDHVGADRLYVPLAGPWLALNDWGDCPIEQPRCDKNTTDKVLLVADGVFQAAGVITMVTGLLSPTTHTVYTRTADAKKIHVTPTHNGFAVLGRF